MTATSSKLSLGLVTDHPEYSNCLSEKSGLHIVGLRTDLEFSGVGDTFPQRIIQQGEPIDLVMVYAHLGAEHRQEYEGISWIRRLRWAGYDTPVILFLWEMPFRVQIRYFDYNPFIQSYFKESCAVIQLPYRIDRVYDALERLRPIDHGRWVDGTLCLSRLDLRHLLTNIANCTTLQKAKECLRLASTDLAYEPFRESINQLIACDSLVDLRSAIVRQFEVISGGSPYV